MEKKAPTRPLTAFFMFLKKKREKNPGLNGKEGGKMWAELDPKEKEVYESEYRKKAEAYEKYMEAQGFKPRRASHAYGEKLSPMGKGVPDHIRTKRIRIVCGSSRKILPTTKRVYKGLAHVMELVMEDIGKAIEDERRKNWEPIVTLDTVCKAITSTKKFDKVTGIYFG